MLIGLRSFFYFTYTQDFDTFLPQFLQEALQREGEVRMFEPDTLLPEQFFTLLGRKPIQGEKRLLLAMLEDAVHCFQTYVLAKKPHERRLFQEAEEWIDSTDAHWYFSFENICDILGIHPGRMRDALRDWKIQQTSQPRVSQSLVSVLPDNKVLSAEV
jgi:hypothetical protein